MSGEIIQMSNKQNLIFEPEDLEQASPATVSRCGMIYMEPHQLGWRPSKESYMESLPASLTQEHKELVNDLFEWLFDPCLCKYDVKFIFFKFYFTFVAKWPNYRKYYNLYNT